MDVFCDDIDSLNLLPINRLAAIKLRAAGVAADPSQLAVFQLMRWGFDSGVPMPHCRLVKELSAISRSCSPGAALKYLLENIPGGMTELHHDLLRLTPREAAQRLLDLLDLRLKADPINPYPG